MKKIPTENILGYPVATLGREECAEEIFSWITGSGRRKYFVCANPHSLVIADSDLEFKESMINADMITPDGSGILVASKVLNGSITQKVSGSAIFRELSKLLNESGNYSCFFLGSTEEVLSLMKRKMSELYPNIKVAGVYSPPFKSEFDVDDNKKMIDAVNKAAPDVLWVAMTAPKQEKWVFQNKDRLEVKFIGPVGAVFDFFTGKVPRSHPFFIKTGLEWLPRLLRQPQRLWRRMLISAPKYIYRVYKQKQRQNQAF